MVKNRSETRPCISLAGRARNCICNPRHRTRAFSNRKGHWKKQVASSFFNKDLWLLKKSQLISLCVFFRCVRNLISLPDWKPRNFDGVVWDFASIPYFWHSTPDFASFSTWFSTRNPPNCATVKKGEKKVLYCFYICVSPVCNLPKNCTDMITEFWEKTLINVSRLFLTSENYFNWLTWFLVLLRTERQESRQSIEIIFRA